MTEIDNLLTRLERWSPIGEAPHLEQLLNDAHATIANLRADLRNAAWNDKSVYDHHETRPFDGAKPNPGTIWRTPREIARRALNEPDLATLGQVIPSYWPS